MSAGAAGVWALVVVVRGGSWWGPLHLLLAGTAVLAISGASQLFTITWSAAAPPDRRLALVQRIAAFAGAVAAVAGVSTGLRWLAVAGAALLVASLGILAFILVSTIRRSLLRRFDLSARFYLLAAACGAVGVSLGGVMGALPETRIDLRLVHLHLNLAGLVGITIFGTIPTFLPTLTHHKAVSGGEAIAAWRLSVAGAVLWAAGLAGPAPRVVGAGSALVAVSGILLLGGILARLPGRVMRRGGASFVAVAGGMAWLGVWMVADAVLLLTGDPRGADGVWLGIVAVAGIAQVLAGSLSYLVPVVTRRRRTPRERSRRGGAAG